MRTVLTVAWTIYGLAAIAVAGALVGCALCDVWQRLRDRLPARRDARWAEDRWLPPDTGLRVPDGWRDRYLTKQEREGNTR